MQKENPKKSDSSMIEKDSDRKRLLTGQAKKSARGMPWHWEPKKDAAICEKPRGAESRL